MARIGSPEWDIFIYITYIRMLKDTAFISVMANPTSKETRAAYSKLVLPPLEEFDRQKKQRTMERMMEWTSTGPVHIAPIGTIKRESKGGLF